jgi:type IV secretion system protein TrbG
MNLKWLYLPTVLILSEALAFGQSLPATSQTNPAPTVMTRVAPPSEAIPSVEKYPFTAMLKAEQSHRGNQADVPPITGIASATEDLVPTAFAMKNVALTPTALDAVALAKLLVNEKNSPTRSADGRVIYIYGVGLPTVVCAPLRVCSLELQAGEHILGEPQIGDSVRWEVTPATTGTDVNAVPVLVLKPKMSGLDTTMLVMTDKRTYYVRLISKPEEFIARTAFSYSDDEHVEWKIFLAEQERVRKERIASSQIATTATAAIDKLYFDYSIKPSKGAAMIMPDRVMDDGEKTYIQMPAVAVHRELPALVIQGPTGNEMVNYRVKDNTYIVDRLFDRAALLMGSGKYQQIVKIVRKESLSVAGGQ